MQASPLQRSRDIRSALYAAADSQALLTVLRREVGLTQGVIGLACGVSERSVRDWEGGVPPRARHDVRLRELADVVGELLGMMTPRGVHQWLQARNRRLGGRSPLELIAEGDADGVLAEIDGLKGGDHG